MSGPEMLVQARARLQAAADALLEAQGWLVALHALQDTTESAFVANVAVPGCGSARLRISREELSARLRLAVEHHAHQAETIMRETAGQLAELRDHVEAPR